MTGRITHGHTRGRTTTRTFNSWLAMRQRCGYAKSVKYARYGGRGIRVCSRWACFENFLADMGPRPAGRTIDRVDLDGNYELNNCRWATPKQQAENRPRSSFATNSRKTHCPKEHPYAGSNLRVTSNGNRKCRTCERSRSRTASSRGIIPIAYKEIAVKKAKPKTRKVSRSAKSGEFVPIRYADAHPSTTVNETVRVSKPDALDRLRATKRRKKRA